MPRHPRRPRNLQDSFSAGRRKMRTAKPPAPGGRAVLRIIRVVCSGGRGPGGFPPKALSPFRPPRSGACGGPTTSAPARRPPEAPANSRDQPTSGPSFLYGSADLTQQTLQQSLWTGMWKTERGFLENLGSAITNPFGTSPDSAIWTISLMQHGLRLAGMRPS